jgi:hypothetical protein
MSTAQVSYVGKSQLDLLSVVADRNVARWSIEELQVLSKQDLHSLAIWCGKGKTALPIHLEKYIFDSRGEVIWTTEDKKIATELFTGIKREKKSPESILQASGGKGYYSPKTIEVVTLDGDKTIYENSPIPIVDPVVYPHQDSLALLFSYMVRVEKGAWIGQKLQEGELVKMFEKSMIYPASWATFQEGLKALLTSDKLWVTMDETARNAVSGPNLLSFIKKFINRLEEGAWIVLNAMVANLVFRLYLPAKQGWIEASGTKALLQKEVFLDLPKEYIKAAKACRTQWSKYCPVPLIYRGMYTPPIGLPEKLSNLTSVLARNKRVAIATGSHSGVCHLTDMAVGHSGLPSEIQRKMDFFLGAAMSCWVEGFIPIIRVATVGDVSYLCSSLQFWSGKIKDGAFKNFEGGTEVHYYIKLTDETMLTNVSPKLRCHVISSKGMLVERAGKMVYEDPTGDKGVIIFYDEGSYLTMKTDDLTEEKIVMELETKVPRDKVPYFGYSFALGPQFFKEDKGCQERYGNKLSARDLNVGVVLAYGSSAMMRGVVTNTPIKSLVGVEVENKKHKLVPVTLQKMVTMTDWYKKIESDQLLLCIRWLVPIVRYSPLSNLLVVSKKSLAIIAEDDVALDGVYVAPRPAAFRAAKASNLVPVWNPDEDEEEEVPSSTSDGGGYVNVGPPPVSGDSGGDERDDRADLAALSNGVEEVGQELGVQDGTTVEQADINELLKDG